MPTDNKPIAFMGVEVKTQASVLRKNSSDYPQCSLLETATNAIAKTLAASGGQHCGQGQQKNSTNHKKKQEYETTNF